jgi:hypothetical protein
MEQLFPCLCQVHYYLRSKSITHEHYNYLQSIFKNTLCTKDIKNAKRQRMGR